MSYEILYTAIVGLFDVIRKITGRKLIVILMMCYTLTTYAFSAARLVTTVAYLLILAYLTFHIKKFLIKYYWRAVSH